MSTCSCYRLKTGACLVAIAASLALFWALVLSFFGLPAFVVEPVVHFWTSVSSHKPVYSTSDMVIIGILVVFLAVLTAGLSGHGR